MGFTKALGTGANVLGGLMAFRQGQLQNYLINRARALQDPQVRAYLEQSPFLQGVLGVGTTENPEMAGFELPANLGGVQAPSGRTTRTLNLPALDPETAVKQYESQGKLRVLATRPDAADIAARKSYGVPMAGLGVGDIVPENEAATRYLQSNREPGTKWTIDPITGAVQFSGGEEGAPAHLAPGAEQEFVSDAQGQPVPRRIGGRTVIRDAPTIRSDPAGTIYHVPGTAPPSPGAAPGRVRPGIPGVPAIIATTPPRGSERTREQRSRITASKQILALYTEPVTDPRTGQPHMNPTTGQPYTPMDAFTKPGAAGAAKQVIGNLPGGQTITALPRRIQSGGGLGDPGMRAATAAASTLQSNVVTYIKGFGDTANVAVREQEITASGLVPNLDTDTDEIAAQKIQTLNEMFDRVTDALAKGGTGTDAAAIMAEYGIMATPLDEGASTSSTGSPPATSAPRTLGGRSPVLSGQDALDYLNTP